MKVENGPYLYLKSFLNKVIDGTWKELIMNSYIKLMNDKIEQIEPNEKQNLLNQKQKAELLLNTALRKRDVSLFADIDKVVDIMEEHFKINKYHYCDKWFYILWEAIDSVINLYGGLAADKGYREEETRDSRNNIYILWEKFNYGIDRTGFPISKGYGGAKKIVNLASVICSIDKLYK